MTGRQSTKRALLTSLMTMAMCIIMLIGTTFAWFTDTASTAVNKITAGELKVALEVAVEWDEDGNVKRWESAEGKTLSFRKADGADPDEALLWEPGCTYQLPELRVRNTGTLALKYKIQITGIKGSEKLNEAIDWTIDGLTLDQERSLAVGADDGPLTIEGQMKTEAGNEYQGLTIDGVTIAVYATQDTVEYDSKDNQYDKDAAFSVSSLQWTSSFTDGATVTVNSATALDGQVDPATGEVNANSEAKLSDAGEVALDLKNTVTSGNLSQYTWGMMRVEPGTTLVISGDENGRFINTKSSSIINVCGGKVIVNSGYFESTTDVFWYYTDIDDDIPNMSLTINGGTFKAEGDVIYTTVGKDGIAVNGGTFYGWDPSKYVDENHQVTTTAEGDTIIYTVTEK